jgi:hypothetical protein
MGGAVTALMTGGAIPASATSVVAAAAVPTITTFSPSGGSVGTVVTISGANLSGATRVTFNGVKGKITKDTKTKIKVKVPSDATTGKVKVVTPGGTVSTATAFKVTSLTFSGVLTGQLVNAVSQCQSDPSTESQITVNGTLNDTPWVLYIDSYDGESGVWQVLTGQAGGGTGLIGSGYSVTATYPATVKGITRIDWASGAKIDVQLASGEGKTPAGNVQVQGIITCG